MVSIASQCIDSQNVNQVCMQRPVRAGVVSNVLTASEHGIGGFLASLVDVLTLSWGNLTDCVVLVLGWSS